MINSRALELFFLVRHCIAPSFSIKKTTNDKTVPLSTDVSHPILCSHVISSVSYHEQTPIESTTTIAKIQLIILVQTLIHIYTGWLDKC